MKLSKLFMIALLAGTLGVLGCDTAESTGNDAGTGGAGGAGGTGGTGGTGGGGGTGGTTDACVGPLCTEPVPKEACNELIGECNNAVQVEIPPESCDAWGNEVFCEEGAGGTGGGGGAGGGGGDPDCNVGACQDDETLSQQCDDAVEWCVAFCGNQANCQQEDCLALGLLICNVEG